MDSVIDFVLESEVAILTGGVDHKIMPLITIPVESADLVDLYGSRDILKLLQFYVRIAGGNVAVLVDLTNGWAKECITKLTSILDDLQTSHQQCITTLYLVKPKLRGRQRFLHREQSVKCGPGHAVPFYKVQRLESHEELHYFVDKHQLTKDYGGIMCYDHSAWMDFHKKYLPVMKAAEDVLSMMPVIQDEVTALYRSDSETHAHSDETLGQGLTGKYEAILRKRKVRETMERCKQALGDIETLGNDLNQLKIHTRFLVNTTTKLRQLNNQIKESVSAMDARYKHPETVKDIYAILKECQENADEVKATIGLLHEHVKELPRVGNNIREACEYRQQFIEEILNPSKEIVSCSSLILNQLDTGKETTPKSYATAFEIAKQLTETLQPFTQDVNNVSDTYTRIHLFYMLLAKVKRWTMKASDFMINNLPIVEPTNVLNKNNRVQTVPGIDHSNEATDSLLDAIDINGDAFANTLKVAERDKQRDDKWKLVHKFSDVWPELLEKFLLKHPPPRRKHLRLLTKNLPIGIKRCLKSTANNLVERTIFILSLLDKNHYKTEDIKLITTWQREHTRTDTTKTPTGLDSTKV